MTELVHAPTIVDDKDNTGGSSHPLSGRPDAEWERANSETAREEWPAARRAMTDDMRERRRQLPLGARVDAAMSRLYRLSNLPAYKVTIGGKGTAGSLGGDRPPGESSSELDMELKVLYAAVEKLERALDVEQGLAPEGAAQLMSTSEKDRELFTLYAGIPCARVAEDHRAQGGKTTILRRRKAAGFDARGYDPETGLPPTPARVDTAVVELSRTMPRAA